MVRMSFMIVAKVVEKEGRWWVFFLEFFTIVYNC